MEAMRNHWQQACKDTFDNGVKNKFNLARLNQ